MSEIIKKIIERNKGKNITIWLKNGFHYAGKLTNFDETFIEILDFKENRYRTINIDQIAQIVEGEK